MKQVTLCTVLVSLLIYSSEAEVNILSRPSVFVVTPSPRSQSNNEARSAPFYYHNWMRRIDSPHNATTTTTTPKVKTPDLIFAEFESDDGNNMRKSIRKLLEQERVAAKTSTTSTTTTTTSQPIYVPEENVNDVVYSVPKKEIRDDNDQNSEVDKTDYFALYNNLYNSPVYLPKTSSTTSTTTTTTTTTPAPSNVENIWHIIDNERHNQYVDKWEEVAINSNKDENDATEKSQENVYTTTEDTQVNEDFALPGFGTNPGNGAENESRAIRTEPNLRFPYVSLKPFQVKNSKKPMYDVYSNSKKTNMFTNLDNFKEMKNPVRGEVQDTVHMQQPIDRYNPAQPYLPSEYGSKSKQSSPNSAPPKAVASLVPPPPPPPKATGDDFPIPTNYESFPPYPPSGPSPVAAPAPPPPSPTLSPPVSMYRPPADTSDDSGPDTSDDSNDSPMDLGYRYKPPSLSFVPTLPPVNKPFSGYSYGKPGGAADTPPAMAAMDTHGYTYKKPSMSFDSPPSMDLGGYSYNKPQMDSPPASDDKPDLHGYYDKPPEDHHHPSYDHHGPPSYGHDSDYPELIFNKPHGDMDSGKGGNDMKGNDMSVMAPPPPPPSDEKPGMDSGPPMDDSGFPHDFPSSFKFHHHGFDDDHDFHHYHHPTTTTTTETPRVNSWRPNDTTASFFSKRSVDSWNLTNENLHEVTGRVTKAIAEAAEKYMNEKAKTE
ncbi:uncharacterized protein DDB_G0284459-like [Ostrinia nubilalis]|uniref:uncharacterized protein DDB_G0284459-like n=1 Tax=Ostrinia nubilalis TaxID=29057 RepID=UPI0030823877